jgi:hypothetical protein
MTKHPGWGRECRKPFLRCSKLSRNLGKLSQMYVRVPVDDPLELLLLLLLHVEGDPAPPPPGAPLPPGPRPLLPLLPLPLPLLQGVRAQEALQHTLTEHKNHWSHRFY